MKQREYYLDNAKALLMFTVVGTHYISLGPRNYYEFFDWLHYYFLIFNLPVFFAISGYLSSKSRKNYESAFQSLLVPYVAMCIFLYFFLLALNGHARLLLFQAPFAMWFLLALFFYRAVSPMMEKLRFPVLFALLAGLGAATIDQLDTELLSMERVFGFFPFYVWGYFGLEPLLARLRGKKKPYRYAVGIASYVGLAAMALYLRENVTRESYLYRHSYEAMGLGAAEGMFWRMAGYACGVIGTLGILAVVSDEKKWYTYIGRNSITVYLGHILFYFIIRKYGLFDSPGWQAALLDLAAIFATVVLLALPPFERAYKKCVNAVNGILFAEKAPGGSKTNG